MKEKKILVALTSILILSLLIAAVYFGLKSYPIAGLDDFLNQQYSTRFYDRNGKLLQIMPLENGLRQEFYSITDLPDELVQAFVNEEDSSFYYHPGVNPFAIIRAARQNKNEGRIVSGASTITMQLVRMIQPRKEDVTLKTKVREMVLAISLETKFSKKQILEMYLNNVPFGFLANGVGSAARTFYGTTPQNLNSEQIKILSKIPRSPSKYAPEKSFKYPNLCQHFINSVKNQYKNQNKILPPDLILSIDSDLNSFTETLIQNKLSEFTKSRIHNGAVLVVHNPTGEIFAWVGNASFNDLKHNGQIDGIITQRQPGSSIKPFLYALALESGFEPNTILPDIQMDFGSNGVYVPYNFNNMFNGPVRTRVALASSLNIPAVYLLQHLGLNSFIDKLIQLKFESIKNQSNNLGLSLALGSVEVSLYEIVQAFSVFPNDGQIFTNLSFEKKDRPADFEKVYNKDTARIICDFLSDRKARTLGFGQGNIFNTSYPSIFKTGTANQFQNIIALGATSEFTVGAWMGNYDGNTVISTTGSSAPATIVRNILDELTKEFGASDFLQPEHYEKKEICSLSGMIASDICPSKTTEYFSFQKTDFCNWHYIQNNRLQIQYPNEFQHWAKGQNHAGTIDQSEENISIKYPRNGAQFLYAPNIPSEFQKLHVTGNGGNQSPATLFCDGQNMGTVSGLLEWDIPLTKGKHVLVLQNSQSSYTTEYFVE